jgi:ribosomal protein L7Ae-like RNA K-turn-binding protein
MLFHARLEACLQLACKAGAVVSGYAALQKALTQRRVACVVLATDIAAARAEEYRAWCERQNVTYISLFSKEALGRLMGRPSRSAIGFTAQHFAEHLQTLLNAMEQWRASLGASEGRATCFTTAS